MSQEEADATERALREQLRLAMLAAQTAYQDGARLIRLLSILGSPGAPEDLVDEALVALSQVFQVDVASVVQVTGDRLVVIASCGLPEDDPAFDVGWAPSEAAVRAMREGRAVALQLVGTGGPARPEQSDEDRLARELGLRSGAWLPLPADDGRVDHLLILYRRRPEVFERADMSLLASVTSRLSMTVQARRRTAALELLARSGHVLAQHRRIGPLLRDAAGLLGELVAADHAAAFSLARGRALPAAPAPSHDRGHGAPPGPPWDLGEVPAERLPGLAEVADGKPRLLGGEHAYGARRLLVVPAGPPGAPTAVLYAAWHDLPPLMMPTVETAAIFATNLSAAIENVSLYQALSASEASLRVITNSISDLIAVVDGACRFVYASASYDRAVGHAPGSLVGRSVLDLVEHDDHVPLRDALLRAISSTKLSTIEYRLHTGDGQVVWAESQLRPAAMPDRNVVMSTRLIQERKEREEELRHQADHDPLTGLANRATATRCLEDALAAEGAGEIGLLFCDLDKFKQVNDTLGHAAGDALLQEAAERLRRCTRLGDLIARLGGDEFVFVLDGVTSVEEVAEIGRRVTRALSEPFALGDETVRVSVSVGAAVGGRGVATATTMLGSADAAMYRAKRHGSRLDPSAVTRVLS